MPVYTVRPVDANFVSNNPLTTNNRVVNVVDVNIIGSEVPIITVPSFPIFAYEVTFDPTNTSLTANDVQAGMEQLDAKVSNSASPGFTWGYQGLIPGGTYLLNDGAPSNMAGRLVTLAVGQIIKVFVTTHVAGMYKLTVQKRNGAIFTDLGSVQMSGVRKHVFSVNYPVVADDELCVKVAEDTPQEPNGLEVGLQLTGSNT